MKRLGFGRGAAAFLSILLCATMPAFATPEAYGQAEVLLKEGLWGNVDELRLIAPDLDEAEKDSLLEKYAQGGWAPSALNLGLGFGIGSWLQRDPVGAVSAGGIELVGLAAVFTGLAFAENYAHGVGDFAGGDALMIGGGALMALGRVFGLVRAPWYANRYRIALGAALAIDPGAAKP